MDYLLKLLQNDIKELIKEKYPNETVKIKKYNLTGNDYYNVQIKKKVLNERKKLFENDIRTILNKYKKTNEKFNYVITYYLKNQPL